MEKQQRVTDVVDRVAMHLDADYLVYGAGAMGMAFVDALLKEKPVKVVMVDRHSQPGGHWNDAYPYVRLHQPSRWYGVNSRILERTDDELELASRSEILAYYEAVMDNMISSGSVQFFPMCSAGDVRSHTFHSLVEPSKTYEVHARAKVVDATYMSVEVPSISDPRQAGRFKVDEGVELVPLNDLTKCGYARQRYVVIGAGKTGMDAVLWLLRNSVDPDRIHWVMPRDSWIVKREVFRISDFLNVVDVMGALDASTSSKTIEEYCLGLEKSGYLTRLDENVQPSQYKCATVSDDEIQQLRRIEHIIRLGRVSHLKKDRIELQKGVVEMAEGALYVDCSTDALATRPSVPVYQGGHITLQSVAVCQQVFSAALLGFVETIDGSDDEKNGLCRPVPHPDVPEDMARCEMQTQLNYMAWTKNAKIAKWIKQSRLWGILKPETAMSWRQTLTFMMKNVHNLSKLKTAEADQLANLTRLAKFGGS